MPVITFYLNMRGNAKEKEAFTMTIQKLPFTGALPYPLEKKCLPQEAVFFDIETTGFSPKTSGVYLIGAVSYEDDCWQMCQWMSDDPEEEAKLLNAFAGLCRRHSTLIHFNGDRFDLPFLACRARMLGIEEDFTSYGSLDLYKSFLPLKPLLKASHMNQKSLQEFINAKREDEYTGGELIPVYRNYLLNHDDTSKQLLLLHNHDDVLGMLSLLSFFAYTDFLEGDFAVREYRTGSDDIHDFSLELILSLPTPLPRRISWGCSSFYLTAAQQDARMLIYGLQGELKYFFPDYKNYYYLPREDTAVHKSVASYVDKEYRTPARASTCYSKKSGFFLPQGSESFGPAFYEDYKSPAAYFECTDEFLASKDTLKKYIHSLLENMTG